MKRSKNDKGELQTTGLDQVETRNPLLVLRSFTEDFSLASVRQLIDTMRDVCITTENIFFGNANTREDLLHMTRHVVRFFEAAYLYLSSPEPQDGKLVVHDFNVQKPSAQPKVMTVLQKSIPSRHLGPYTFPYLTLSGKCMEKAGFHARDEVSIIHGHQKILITMYREWDNTNKEFKRA